MEDGSGEEQSWKPEAEAEEVPVVGYVVLFCLFGLVCLAAYVPWRLHRKRGDGLQGPAYVGARPAWPAQWPRCGRSLWQRPMAAAYDRSALLRSQPGGWLAGRGWPKLGAA
eukprot:scaffold10681_cov71-Phaeocystis_antarctica.AAC.4